MKYRSINKNEIKELIKNGCSCKDWNRIFVSESFTASNIKNSRFSGEIYLGEFRKKVKLFGGVTIQSGIYNSSLHNCSIGSNSLIMNVWSHIANYDISEDVIIQNVNIIAVDGESSFGNGTLVPVLNENGGRGVIIFDKLSSHFAYMFALYRHNNRLVNNLKKVALNYTESVTSNRGYIGKLSSITNSKTVKNVRIGEYSKIDGIEVLENGSINSVQEDPIEISNGVIMKNFIISSGSVVSDGTIVFNSFIGQACKLIKQYSADSSLFFANCGGSHGEAWSIFAGPYTVSYHKSTLLISGMFSFLNAGSGSNQSNHMYKLGPLHQGIVERGSKTTSDSYLLWPARIGPFTLVMGRHYRNSDTSLLPYSYLIENKDESILVPGANLRSVGTIRDAKKWPSRDNRKDPEKLDCINFNMLSPYTVQKMMDGINIMKELSKTSGKTSEFYTYNGVKIRNTSLKKGIAVYELAIVKFLGNELIKRLEGIKFSSAQTIIERLKPSISKGVGTWVDISGMFAPKEVISELEEDITSGSISSIEEINNKFKEIHESYREFQWSWCIDRLCKIEEKKIEEFTPKDIIRFIEKWKIAVVKLDNMFIQDSQKEFSDNSEVGFGIDGYDSTRKKDFNAVRGKFSENSFVCDVQNHIEAKESLGNELISRLANIS